MTCQKCSVSKTCPKAGTSPLSTKGNKKAFCFLMGGYGRTPVDPSKLSPESMEISKRDGPCVTIAYIPSYDEFEEKVSFSLTKIFSPPVLHAREKTNFQLDALYPKSHNR